MKIIPEDEAALCRIYCKHYDREWFEFYEKNEFKYVNKVPINLIDRIKYVFYMLNKTRQTAKGEKAITMAVPICMSDLNILAKALDKCPQDIDVKPTLIPSESDNFYSHKIFFQSKFGLTISVIFNHVSKIESINLGYIIEKSDIKKLKKEVFSYILFSKGKYFCEYKNMLTDSDIDELVSVITYLNKYINSDINKFRKGYLCK